MDVTILSPESIKIKGKTASFLIEPKDIKGKVQADAILSFDTEAIDEKDIEGLRLVIRGVGEYEIGGVKISGVKNQDTTIYYLSLDKMIVMVGRVSALKGKEVVKDADVAILLADGVVNTATLATLNASAAIFYGPQAEESIKALGKESTAVSKYTITREKLPTELEAVLLS